MAKDEVFETLTLLMRHKKEKDIALSSFQSLESHQDQSSNNSGAGIQHLCLPSPPHHLIP
jgi:hypothetical protein